MRKKPNKPTEPYGYISFGRDGTVRKGIFQLSHEKDAQESDVMEIFRNGVNNLSSNLNIVSFSKLPESDHDFRLATSKGPIAVQLTELVEQDYTTRISKEQYKSADYPCVIQKGSGEVILAVDPERLRISLKRCVERKLEKHYAKPSSEMLWLVIFCTSPFLAPEYFEGGKLKISAALVEVRRYLGTVNCVFDEIWYTNLQTAPIRIWPDL